MKNTTYLLLLLLLSTFAAKAQVPVIDTTSNGTTGTENFLDLQANVYGDIFGNKMNVEEFKNIDDFKSLVNKMNATPTMKAKLIEQYEAYDNSLDPTKKELAKAQFNELLLKALKEGQEKDN